LASGAPILRAEVMPWLQTPAHRLLNMPIVASGDAVTLTTTLAPC
jgi:hypothetical protein